MFTPLTTEVRQRLKDLHKHLLRLHKVLLDDERRQYEKANGPIASTSEVLRLVMYDPWFDWLHLISKILIRIDVLEDDPDASLESAYEIFADTRSLFATGPNDLGFGARYRACLQREPAAVIHHADVQRVLFTD